jgi:hypothetical protein
MRSLLLEAAQPIAYRLPACPCSRTAPGSPALLIWSIGLLLHVVPKLVRCRVVRPVRCRRIALGGGDAAGQVVLFGLGFGAYGEGVEDAGGEGVADGLGGVVAEVALTEDLHADDAFALSAHLFDYGDDCVWVGVHVGADGVEADEVDLDPGGGGGGFEGGQAVAGDAVGADDAFLFRFREDVHGAAVADGPVGLGGAVDEDDVDVVDAEFAAEAVEVALDAGGVAGVGFGEDGDFVAGEALDGLLDVGVGAVGVGCVEEAEAVVVEAVAEQVGGTAGAGLIRAAAIADGAGAHGEAAGADACGAEDDLVAGGVFVGEWREVEIGGAGGFGGEAGGGEGGGGEAGGGAA